MPTATTKQAPSSQEQQQQQLQSMYSVSVDDPDQEGVSVGTMHLRPGQRYVVRLAGFPPSLPLSPQLIGSQEVADPVTKVRTVHGILPTGSQIATNTPHFFLRWIRSSRPSRWCFPSHRARWRRDRTALLRSRGVSPRGPPQVGA